MDADTYTWLLLALIAWKCLVNMSNGHELRRITRELRRGRRQAAAVQAEGNGDDRDQGPGDPEAASSAFLRWPGGRGPGCRR